MSTFATNQPTTKPSCILGVSPFYMYKGDNMLHRPTTPYGMIAESASKLGGEMENWHKTFR